MFKTKIFLGIQLFSLSLALTLFAFEINPVSTRLHNIHLMQNALKHYEYNGYDLIILSSTTSEEADYQQIKLEKAFEGTCTKEGRSPLILSVIDTTEGGQVIGSAFTWKKAEEKMFELHGNLISDFSTLIDYVKSNHLKVAIYHNGGKGERFSPLTQSLGNSRGSQKLVGFVKNAYGENIELDVLLSVILQCSSFAYTNAGTHIDTFWTSQIAFGSIPHDQLIRSNHALDKFLVGFDQHKLIPQNIADFGTAALNKKGRMIAFYGNKRFASRKGNEYVINHDKIKEELFDKGEHVAYDFGSFSTSFEMWELILDYWKRKNVFSSLNKDLHTTIKRDIDPHFIQPFICFIYGLNELANREFIDHQLPLPSKLGSKEELNQAVEMFNIILASEFPKAHEYIWKDVLQEKDIKKQNEAIACMHEVIEFYLLYRLTPSLKDLKTLFGYVDLGEEIQWFRYRRPIDILNEKFEMLTDLLGKKIEIQLDSQIIDYSSDKELFQRSCESRLMRGLSDSQLAHFKIEGKEVTLSLDEIKKGTTINDVFIKNSIILNSDLSKGSIIENSIINHVIGKVIAHHAYIESSVSPSIEASSSVVHHVLSREKIQAKGEVVSDVFKSTLNPPYHGRMRAPIGYDPKGMPLDQTIQYFLEKIPYNIDGIKEYSDKTARTEDGRFTFEQIREIHPHRENDTLLKKSIEFDIKEEIQKERSES